MSYQGYQQGYNQNYQQGVQQSFDQNYAQTGFQTQGHHVQQQIQPGGQPSHGSGAWHASDSGSFNGGTYQISHRDTNSILSVSLQQGGAVKSKPGAMIEMAGTIKLEGEGKFSLGKMLTGSMYTNLYTGTGAVTLAPILLGDIATIQVDGSVPWRIGRDAFLAATQGVNKQSKSQGFGKAMFSGEKLFVYEVSGQGLMWVSSFGAITRREIPAGESHIVDNGHLVAWNCDYKIEKAGGGFFTSMKTGEGVVCRFTGPGTVYIQTRNVQDFADLIAEIAGVEK